MNTGKLEADGRLLKEIVPERDLKPIFFGLS
jgi:hypothetical protein